MPVLLIEIPWGPDIIEIGGFLLTWHGLFTALGILVGVRISLYLANVVGYDYDDAYALALVGVPSGIVGARLLYVWEKGIWDVGEIIRLDEGGISIWGAILGGIGGALVFGLWKGYPVGRGLDIGAFGLIMGQAIGRLGDIVNGEHLARPTDLPWGVIYTSQESPAFARSLSFGATHPATTYELLGDLVIFGALFYLLFRVGVFWRRPGLTFFAYLLGYAVMRFFFTYLRVDSSETFLFDLRVPQLVSVLVVLGSIPLVWYFATRPPIEEPAPPPPGRIPIIGRR